MFCPVWLQSKVILCAGMPGRITQMGREEFAELVQSSIQDCQVRTSNPCRMRLAEACKPAGYRLHPHQAC